ncbi:MAG: 30S ribosomal protein S20 [Anaerorhabdus sp.]
MANIKSQKKRAITNMKKNEVNSAKKTALKTAIKEVFAAVEAKDKEKALETFNKANSLLDKTLACHIKHKNYVARQKSRLARSINSI